LLLIVITSGVSQFYLRKLHIILYTPHNYFSYGNRDQS